MWVSLGTRNRNLRIDFLRDAVLSYSFSNSRHTRTHRTGIPEADPFKKASFSSSTIIIIIIIMSLEMMRVATSTLTILGSSRS